MYMMALLRQLTGRFALLCSLTLLLMVCAFGGDNDWRPISPAELAEKTPVIEKDADAEAIFWEVRVDDSSTEGLSLQNYVRVKIFTERGREKFSKREIEYIKGTSIKDIAARVIKPDGSIIELKKDDIFESTVVKANGIKQKKKSFALPGIEVGSIVEYRYREVYADANATMSFIMQRDIPLRTISYFVKPFSYSGSRMFAQYYRMPQGRDFVKDKNDFYRITLENVPAVGEEPFMPPDDELRTSVQLMYWQGNKLEAAEFWKRYGAFFGDLFKGATKPSDEIKALTQQVTAGATTPDEQVARIFRYCQTEIKNISYLANVTEEDRKSVRENKKASDVLKRRIGDGNDINMLFTAMARAAGLDARMALVADRSERFFQPGMYGFDLLHPSVVAVKAGEGWRFYDPASPYLPPGMLVWYEEGTYALVLSGSEWEWVRTPVSKAAASNVKRTGRFKLKEDGTLEGTVEVRYMGHRAVIYKNINDNASPEARQFTIQKDVREELSTAELDDIRVENAAANGDQPFTYKYTVRVPDYAQRTGKRLFIKPNYFEYGSKSPFTSATRKYDIYFNYGWSEEDDIEIQLPEGYELENPEAPAPLNIKDFIVDNVRMMVSKDGKTLTYKRAFSLDISNVMLVDAKNYGTVRQIFDAVTTTDTHSLTLKQTTGKSASAATPNN